MWATLALAGGLLAASTLWPALADAAVSDTFPAWPGVRHVSSGSDSHVLAVALVAAPMVMLTDRLATVREALRQRVRRWLARADSARGGAPQSPAEQLAFLGPGWLEQRGFNRTEAFIIWTEQQRLAEQLSLTDEAAVRFYRRNYPMKRLLWREVTVQVVGMLAAGSGVALMAKGYDLASLGSFLIVMIVGVKQVLNSHSVSAAFRLRGGVWDAFSDALFFSQGSHSNEAFRQIVRKTTLDSLGSDFMRETSDHPSMGTNHRAFGPRWLRRRMREEPEEVQRKEEILRSETIVLKAP